jgi:hypothetical protein
MPVEVQATMEDGTLLHRVWDGRERSHDVVVDSASRIKTAVLDPDGRLLETARFNNHYPRRVRSWFWPRFSDDDAYDIAHLPWVSYDDGVTLGVVLAGGRSPRFLPPTWAQASHLAVVAAGYNLARRTAVSRASYSEPLGLPGGRALWSVSARRDRQSERATLGARAVFGPHLYRSPFHLFSVSVRAVRQFPGDSLADSGTVTAFQLSYTLRNMVTDFYPLRGGLLAVELAGGRRGLGSDWTFARFAGRAEVYRRVLGTTKVAVNLVAGATAGSAPRQEQFALTQAGNFRAPDFSTVVGERLTAANGELRVPLGAGTLLSVAAFGSVARYWGSGPEAAAGLRHEAGIGLRLFDNAFYGVQLDVPFWTGEAIGTRKLDFGRLSVRFGRPFRGPGL